MEIYFHCKWKLLVLLFFDIDRSFKRSLEKQHTQNVSKYVSNFLAHKIIIND